MSDTLKQALEYVDWGWSVLPVKPDEKRPYMANWLSYQHHKADKPTVESWFSNLSGAGVGVVTGKISGIVVLDIERYCKIPIDTILKKYPTQLVARSGGGGYHLYFSYPRNMGRVSNRVGVFEGADIRADGGFIVVAPTLHPSGSRYEWVRKGPPGVFPQELLDLSSRPVNTQSDNWISEALRGVSQGARNDTCARLAGYFFSKGMSYDIVESLLLEWSEKCDPPMPLHELRTTIKSIERSHAGVDQQFTKVEFEDDRHTSAREEPKPSTFAVMKMTDYVKGYGSEGVSWLVDEWLPDGSITFLVSPPESYKTWILLDLAVSVSAGVPFLGKYRVNSPGPTMIIQQEDSHAGLTDRLALIAEQKLGALPKLDGEQWTIPSMPDIPIYVHPDRQLRFGNKKVIEEMEQQIATLRPKVIMIDPLYSTTDSTDNYMADLANRMMVLKTWRDKYGCSFVIAHHSKKNLDPDSTAREDSWGSQFLNAFLEAGWQVRRNPRLAQNEVVVRRHSKVMGNQSSISLTFDISTIYPMKYSVTTRHYDVTPQPTNRGPVYQDAMLDLLRQSSMTQADLCNATGKGKSTVSRQIRQLEAAGLVEKMPDGKWKAKEEK